MWSASWVGVRSMYRPHAPRPIAVARRSGDVQPTAVLATVGMIAALLLMWIGLVL